MSSGGRSSLKIEGRGLGLPSSCCQGLAMMAALSVSGVAYSTDALIDADVKESPVLVVTGSSGDRSLVHGYAALVRRLGPVSGAPNAAVMDSVLQLFDHKITPAYNYITIAVPEHYAVRCAAKQYLGRSMLSRLDELVGWTGMQALREIKAHVTIYSMAAATAVAREALSSMDGLLRLTGASPGGFAFGAVRPGLIDCTVFAATTSLLLADFGGAGCGPLRAWQQEVQGEFPLLVAHAEAVRVVIGASSPSRKTPPTDNTNFDSDSAYREGRLRFLLGTVGFMSLYFLATNAGTILALLDVLEEDEDGEERNAPDDGASQN